MVESVFVSACTGGDAACAWRWQMTGWRGRVPPRHQGPAAVEGFIHSAPQCSCATSVPQASPSVIPGALHSPQCYYMLLLCSSAVCHPLADLLQHTGLWSPDLSKPCLDKASKILPFTLTSACCPSTCHAHVVTWMGETGHGISNDHITEGSPVLHLKPTAGRRRHEFMFSQACASV